ncbi:MAG TPA: hypothetical protein VGA56_22600 [Opitutaceae bacterium]
MRVEGTLVADQNFCQLSIHGLENERVLSIRCIDKTGALRWSHDIAGGELH